ncbi:massive surface protein MspF [Catellicoccus marimammalium M35/04/3]|uniref:Massive surface protein MspF n=2 Tax=Catellicoccus TaxID=300418 RepID=K8Z7K1_9ENTE|nr:massive surface protein MspF [Catellicoccus marimammalium M35/04/3]
MKKGDASTEDADKAIQAIEDAINELGAPATTISLEQLREAIHEAERLYRATENAAVTGRDELGKEIKAAKDLLASAKDGKVTNKQVTDEIKKLEDAMNNVKFDKKDLLDEVAAVQKLASNVYMTKDGEEKFVKAMTAIMNLDANSDNYGKFLEAKSVLADAKAGLEKQPNKADGEALNKAMNRVKELAKLPNQGKDLYGTPALKEAYNKANQLMTEMKKVTDKENKATVKISKAEVEKATQDLNLAFDNLGLNEDALNTFIKAAKDLESKDDKFTNNVEFKKAVVDLEVAAKDTHFENYGKIVDAARKVYDMMIQDLQTVYNGVLPWNNNQAEVNPEVNVISPKLGVKAIKEDTAATPGTTLSQKEFVSDIVSKAGHVADYYTKDSYDKFATALTVAQTILADAKTKDKVSSSASVSAQAGVQVNNAMKELVDAQEGLRFNKDKLIEFSNNGHAAVQKWQIEAKKAVSQKQKSGATATVSTVEQVEANGKAANQGFWALGYQQNGKWMGHKDESGKTFLEGLTDEQLKPNKENAEKLAQMMYNAENDYYTYAYTVAPQLKK